MGKEREASKVLDQISILAPDFIRSPENQAVENPTL